MSAINTPKLAPPADDPLAVLRSPDCDHTLPVLDRAGAVAYCHSLGLTAVTPTAIKNAVILGQLDSFKVLGKLRFAPADLKTWLLSMRRPAGGDAA